MSSPSQDAIELHEEALVIDLHADTFELVAAIGYDFAARHRSMVAAGHLLGHVDLPRLRQGGVSAQLFGVVIPPWSTTASAVAKLRRQGELVDRTCAEHPTELLRATTAAQVLEAAESGRVAVMIGVEGSHGLVGNDRALDELTRQRVTYLGPAHLFDSKAGLSHFWHRGSADALPPAGRRLVEELQDRSILIDLAHMARGPFMEVCQITRRPVIVSHTGVSGIYPHWRNIDDEQLRAVAERGGVVGVIMTPRYLGRPGAEGVVDHIEHILAAAGEDTPALGSDFDGLVKPPRDMVDASGLALITDALLRRGHGESTIRKILGENVLRVLR